MLTLLSTEAIGAFATAASVLSLVPQVQKTYVSRRADDLSGLWLSVALVGSVAWTIYGCLSSAWAIVIANILVGAMIGSLLIMKLVFRD